MEKQLWEEMRQKRIPINERTVRQAAHARLHPSPIESVPMALRQANEARYAGRLPGHSFATDPLNVADVKAKREDLIATVLSRVAAPANRFDTTAGVSSASAALPSSAAAVPAASSSASSSACAASRSTSAASTTTVARPVPAGAALWRPDVVFVGMYEDLRNWPRLPCAADVPTRAHYVFCRGNRTVYMLGVLTVMIILSMCVHRLF